MLKKYAVPLGIWLLFAAVAVGLWLGLQDAFYLFNFLYIGTGLAAGLALFAQGKKWARNAVQWVVGLYLLSCMGVSQINKGGAVSARIPRRIRAGKHAN